jgi:surface antigen
MTCRLPSRLFGSITALFCLVVQLRADEPKYTIKDVMSKAMKGGLLAKVAEGKSSDDDRKLLLELLEALASAPVPKGSEDDWKARTGLLVEGAKGVIEKIPGSNDKLRAAAHCASCHNQHRP